MPERINIPSDEFTRYKKLMAEKSAIERQTKQITEAWEKAGLLPDKTQDNVGKEYVITNGNGDEMGKVTVYACAEKVVPAFIARRIS